MTVDLLATTVIERPPGEVAAFAGDPSNAPAWYRRIESADWQTPPPVRLGSRIRLRARFLGRDLDQVFEVVEMTPGEQVVMRTVDGPFPMRTTSAWRPLSDRATHMALRNECEPVGFARLLAPFVRVALRRAMAGDLAELKRVLEAR
jgi:hypothetical protein